MSFNGSLCSWILNRHEPFWHPARGEVSPPCSMSASDARRRTFFSRFGEKSRSRSRGHAATSRARARAPISTMTMSRSFQNEGGES